MRIEELRNLESLSIWYGQPGEQQAKSRADVLEQQTFSVKGQTVNILGSVDHMVSVTWSLS